MILGLELTLTPPIFTNYADNIRHNLCKYLENVPNNAVTMETLAGQYSEKTQIPESEQGYFQLLYFPLIKFILCSSTHTSKEKDVPH